MDIQMTIALALIGLAGVAAGFVGILLPPGERIAAALPLVVGAGEWNKEPEMHDERSGIGAATTASGRICTGGGEVPGRPDTVPSIECLDGNAWQRVATMRVPRHGLAVVAERNRVHFVAGGPQPGAAFSDAHEILEV